MTPLTPDEIAAMQAASMALNGLPAVKVDRPTLWGNPYRIGEVLWTGDPPLSAEKCVDYFAAWIVAEAFEHGQTAEEFTAPLRGKNLACWCAPGQPCHACILLDLANPEPAT